MAVELASREIRMRMSDVLGVWQHLQATEPSSGQPVPDYFNALKGLWLVSLYGCLERAINAVVEQVIFDISAKGLKSRAGIPAIHSLFHYSEVQSLRDCSGVRSVDRAVGLFERIHSDIPLTLQDNPIAPYLQNVDGQTMISVCRYFGATGFSVGSSSLGRLNNLRERRNSLAHGRESPSEVGERWRARTLKDVYDVTEMEIYRFVAHMENYCAGRRYMA